MTFLYSILLSGLLGSIRTAAFFGNAKAKQWIVGRKNAFPELEAKLETLRAENIHCKFVWMHCASLGEFEQGRPLLEKLKASDINLRIVLTFFSPSGYEIRKSYSGADHVMYLPSDSVLNADKFLTLIMPQMAFFVKYDLWYHYLNALTRLHIPHYLISASFRKEQYFFKFYGAWALERLRRFTHIFVQEKSSIEILNSNRILSCSVTGDTRIDRVMEIKNSAKEIPFIAEFVQNNFVLVCGSTWEPDEALIRVWLKENENNTQWKLILAPHVIKAEKIERLQQSFSVPSIRFSEVEKQANSEHAKARILIIDNIGMLSSLYRYGTVAYIGGGFGKSIHNTLEPAVFGLPVLFGPKYEKFKEAVDLVNQGGAFCVRNASDLKNKLSEFMQNENAVKKSSNVCSSYIENNKGAVDLILKKIYQ